jgi:hypothetical protein
MRLISRPTFIFIFNVVLTPLLGRAGLAHFYMDPYKKLFMPEMSHERVLMQSYDYSRYCLL